MSPCLTCDPFAAKVGHQQLAVVMIRDASRQEPVVPVIATMLEETGMPLAHGPGKGAFPYQSSESPSRQAVLFFLGLIIIIIIPASSRDVIRSEDLNAAHRCGHTPSHKPSASPDSLPPPHAVRRGQNSLVRWMGGDGEEGRGEA